MLAIKSLLLIKYMVSAPLPMYPLTEPCSASPLKGSATCNTSLDLETRLDDLVGQLMSHATLAERAGLLQNTAGQVDGLHIAAYNWWFVVRPYCYEFTIFACVTDRERSLSTPCEIRRNEALHGVAGEGAIAVAGVGACFHTGGILSKKKCATSFPAAVTTACSFNRSLVRAIGSAVGTEARVFSNLGHAGLTFWTPNVRNDFFLASWIV